MMKSGLKHETLEATLHQPQSSATDLRIDHVLLPNPAADQFST